MAAFHPFPRLPPEIRIKIWRLVTEDRVLRVEGTPHSSRGYRSPTQVPAVTRSCRESREYCSYRKAFIIKSSPRYIWANFNRDVIHTSGRLLSAENIIERDNIRNLRVELRDDQGYDAEDSFYYYGRFAIPTFPKLGSFDLLVYDGLTSWTLVLVESNWGCPREKVRIVDAKTGEWIDEETSGPYQDCMDNSEGTDTEYLFTRVIHEVDYDEEERIEAMKRLQMPRPRIDLGYMHDEY